MDIKNTKIKLGKVEEIPPKAVRADLSKCLTNFYKYKYTTGPFMLPQNTHSLNWNLLNNDSTQQKVRVTVFSCGHALKTVEPPGPLEIILDPGENCHNANRASGGFCHEIQVECNSKLVFPSVEAWPGAIGDVIPGTQIRASEFIQEMS
jgi:hypothetical protein